MAAIFLAYPHLTVLVASGRQALVAWIAAGSGILNLLLNLLIIPRFAMEGAAWATVRPGAPGPGRKTRARVATTARSRDIGSLRGRSDRITSCPR